MHLSQPTACSLSTDSLYRIDPATGAAILIGPHGLNVNFAQGMDFDNSSGELYQRYRTRH